MKHVYRVLALSLLTLSLPAVACINDRDSDKLEREVEAGKPGLPDVMRIITGRFERNPPLFYQMRLQRVAKELQTNPKQLALYDDAAAAADRLHRSDEAIAWMEKKHALLQKRKPFAQLSTQNREDKELREAWYRYYANAGTFIAHRWLQSGADRSKIGEMKRAAQMIETAIKIKPNAHFGREKYQLMAMKWIINPPKATQHAPLPGILHDKIIKAGYVDLKSFNYLTEEEKKSDLKKMQLEDAVEGLSGLVVLGAAWESLDIFHSLQQALIMEGKGSLEQLTRRRCLELIDKGKSSLYSKTLSSSLLKEVVAPKYDIPIRSYTPQQMAEIYDKLRREAEEYHQNRTDYMLARLEKGEHPDTHPNFWNEWRDAGPPAPVPYTFWEKRGTPITILAGALLLSLAALGIRRRNKRKL
jgi:hypothetical protein